MSPLPSIASAGARRARAGLLASFALVAVTMTACGPPPKPPPPMMDKFNAGLCPKLPPEDTSRPLDPNLDGVRVDLTVPQRSVRAAADLRIALMFRNVGLHGLTLSLPRGAFTLEGFQLVDHACVPVRYAAPTTARALAYRSSGPMPLNTGESATIDSTIDGLAPGLELRRGIYAVRFALHVEPAGPTLRGRTLYSDWATFAVRGLDAE